MKVHKLLIPGCIALLLSVTSHFDASAVRQPAAATPILELDALDTSAGSDIWLPHGKPGFGPFRRIGSPKVEQIAGATGVLFDGKQDAYLGPETTPQLEGASPRSIEVWVYNPRIDSAEETMISWGKRGGRNASMLAFGYGSNGGYGAVTHWADDMGWEGVPRPGQWHQLVYTYDGATARIYDNTAEKSSHETRLATSRTAISIAAEMSSAGTLQFKNEYDGGQQAGSLYIGKVTIYAAALTGSQIADHFQKDASRFHAVALPSAAKLLEAGATTYFAGGLKLSLLNATQTPQSLGPANDTFDFLPSDRLNRRIGDRYVHLGDISLRVRDASAVADTKWQEFDTSAHRVPLIPVKSSNALTSCNLDTALGPDCPLSIDRTWINEGGELVLRYLLRNKTGKAVEIGAFGSAMVFNNLLTGRRIDQAYTRCSFADPYIGAGAGYLQVTRLAGAGNALLVLPEAGTGFEAYRQIKSDPTPREVTFEGFYEWMANTTAYADNEWKRAQPWNIPTSRTIPAGGSTTYGFRFVLTPAIRDINKTLVEHKMPVAFGVPGYVVPTDQFASLFLNAPTTPTKITVEPANALAVTPRAGVSSSGWKRYSVVSKLPGRARVTLTYADKSVQTIQYFVTLPEAVQTTKLGEFHATKQWYTDPNDPFGRTFSFMPFNREKNAIELQHAQVWMSGLSDEMGAGPSVAVAMKNLYQPDKNQIELLETYVDKTLWGKLQLPNYGVRASLFYDDPRALPNFHYTIRGGWDKPRTETTWRAFNYPHVAAVYWALYKLAKFHPQYVTHHPAKWYLNQASGTGLAMFTLSGGQGGLAQFGLMVGSVFPEILKDLGTEGMTAEAAKFEGVMRQRVDIWSRLKYPFASEMPWDSTGQEEIYTWCKYMGVEDKAEVTVNAILGYMSAIPNWAYNGAARRYFDAPVNGTRWPEIGRMTNHYGSTLNAIPLLSEYREHPDDLYMLRVGYAGMDQIMANIDEEGHGSYGFDANPAILKFDPYTADYGIAFYGYAYSAGAYAANSGEFGWLGFGCNIEEKAGTVTILPRDAFRKRVYIGSLGLWLTLDAGKFEKVTVKDGGSSVQVTLAPATAAEGKTASLNVQTFKRGTLPALKFRSEGFKTGTSVRVVIGLSETVTNFVLRQSK